MKFKKPKFWDYKKPNILSYILLLFTFPLIINNFFLNLKKTFSTQELKQFVWVIFILVGLEKRH